MRHRIYIALLICLVFFLVGCNTASKNSEKDMALDFDVQYIRTNGFTEEVNYPIISLIYSMDDLDEYYAKNSDAYDLERRDEVVHSDSTIGFLNAVDKYNVDYFDEHILVFVLLQESSGSVRHDITGIKRIENDVEIDIKRIVPEQGTDDMAQWHIMVELKREAYNDSEIIVKIE